MEQYTVEYRNPVKACGFAMVYHAVSLDLELSDGAFRTLCVLHMYAQKRGLCFPSRSTVSDRRGKGESTLSRHYQELERLGYIEREQRDSHTWLIIINDEFVNTRLQNLAEHEIASRGGGLSKMRSQGDVPSQKREPEEEQEREKEKNHRPPAAAGMPARPQAKPSYQMVSEPVPEYAETPFTIALNAALKTSGKRPLTPAMVKKLQQKVYCPRFPGEPPAYHSSPAELYSQPIFQRYVGERVRQMRELGFAAGRLVHYICNYTSEKGWFAFEAANRQPEDVAGGVLAIPDWAKEHNHDND